MAITAADVKKLRDATGAGMMDAKKALTAADGDFDKAIEALRVAGAAKAAKRSDRSANNGLVASADKTLIQIGSETDFVAKSEDFVNLADQVVQAAAKAHANTVDEVLALDLGGETVQTRLEDLRNRIGEKIELSKVATFDGDTHVYLHRRSPDLPPQVGVLVEYEGNDQDFVHSVALQIASMRPDYVTREDVPAEVVEREERIATETAKEEGKPEKIIPKIVSGRVNAFFKDTVLTEQAALSDEKKTIGQLAKAAGVKITRFVRFSAGN
uniref:translation elongation factor Ts n=1 Tax=Vaginimicrobium propionicum TaxID=1871034 RepID=UPI0009714023|nr:translation elongation factor Ts [Vaginimicrobium propionicum]